ncbi:MAG: ATP-binding protein [Candidatus Jordarchaeum sp.]|uniref:ATP-binding protein n=1 Tax=Candidatus Jordarchaeum sp. TaxID=2823881 RepID=UPI00404AD94C
MVRISEIVSQNPWWKHGKAFTRYDRHLSRLNESLIFFERKEFETIKENAYIIRGCRQVGKTTYLKEWVNKLVSQGFDPKRILYLSLDFFTSRKEMRNAINYFLEANREAQSLYMFLDEATTLRDWNLELKYLWDSGITGRAYIVATGSSGFALRKKGELLPGRGLEGNEYYLKPLSFREFVLQTADYVRDHVETKEFRDALKRLKTSLEKVNIDLKRGLDETYRAVNAIIPFKKELEYLFRIYLVTGGFPEVINRYLRKRFAKEKGYIDPTLAEIFVRNVLGDVTKQGRQETFAVQMLKEIINKYGTRYTFSKLARGVETTHTTVIDYLELLEDSFILTVLHAYDFNKQDLKFKGLKKVYFQDPFIFYALRSSLGGVDVNEVVTEVLEDEELLSKIVEGMVTSHLSMSLETPIMREPRTFLWFYYEVHGREIDNVVRLNGSFTGIETKYRGEISYKDVLRIPQIKNYIILSREDVEYKKNILVVPIDVFLSLLTKSDHNL